MVSIVLSRYPIVDRFADSKQTLFQFSDVGDRSGSWMEKLPLIRVAEVAFLASNVKECVEFCRMSGMGDLPAKPGLLNFAHVGVQLDGVFEDKSGFSSLWTGCYSQ